MYRGSTDHICDFHLLLITARSRQLHTNPLRDQHEVCYKILQLFSVTLTGGPSNGTTISRPCHVFCSNIAVTVCTSLLSESQAVLVISHWCKWRRHSVLRTQCSEQAARRKQFIYVGHL